METSSLNAFLEKHGTALTEDGYAGIECRGIFVNLQIDGSTGAPCLYAAIGRLPDPVPPKMVEKILGVNLLGAATEGGYIGLYSPSRTLVYSRRLLKGEQPPDYLEETLENFVEHMLTWVSKLDCAPLDTPEMTSLEGLMANGRVLWG